VRYARRVDANQAEIVALLRQLGCIVEVTSDVGRGFPDLVVKTPKGTVLLVEVKDGSKPKWETLLTPAELATWARWGESYCVVATEGQARGLATL
jgi:hypothetical protein